MELVKKEVVILKFEIAAVSSQEIPVRKPLQREQQ